MEIRVLKGLCRFDTTTLQFAHLEKLSLNFSSWSFVIRISILVPLWFIIICLVFFFLS